MALALAKELRLQLMGSHVRRVLARLAVEVHMRVTTRRRRIVLAIAPTHALDRRPGLNQGAIDAEVLRGQQSLAPCPLQTDRRSRGHACRAPTAPWALRRVENRRAAVHIERNHPRGLVLALRPAPGRAAKRRTPHQPLWTSMRRGRNSARLGMRTASTPSFKIASI
jgi:hypothetical protein